MTFTLNLAGLPPLLGFVTKVCVVVCNIRYRVLLLVMRAGWLVYIYLQFFIHSRRAGTTELISSKPIANIWSITLLLGLRLAVFLL